MNYDIFGPFDLPRENGQIYLTKVEQADFWESIEAEFPLLSGACGCYVFGVRAAKGTLPWYVGKAAFQSFGSECFTSDKIVKYNRACRGRRKGTPVLFFYAKVTPGTGRFSRPSGNGARDIALLENMLIGIALKRNSNLVNIKDTKHFTQMVVPGLLNSRKGKLQWGASKAKEMMGY